MAKIVRPKSYGVYIVVTPTAERYERLEGGLAELTALILGAPEDSLLRQIAVEEFHTPAFPRLRVEIRGGGRRTKFGLRFYLLAEQDTDKFAEEVYAILHKNGWEH